MAKRGNSEGSIRHRPDGLWEARATLPDGSRKSVYAKTRSACAEKLRVLLQSVSEGLSVSSDPLLSEYLGQWLEHVARPSVRRRTYDSYAQHVRDHIIPELGRLRLSRLTPARCQALWTAKTAEGLSPTTVARIRGTLRRALSQAVSWGYVGRNAAALTHSPKQVRFVPTVLDVDQAKLLIDTVKDHRIGAIYILALGVGLRLGEAQALQWSDVNLEAGSIRIDKSLTLIDRVPTLVPPKSERAHRTLTLPPFVVAALRRHRSRQAAERLAKGGTWPAAGPSGGYVFLSRVGTPLYQRNIANNLERATRRAGLPHLRFHDLRHTCATLLLVQEVSPRMVQEILGHSSVALTLGIYSHVLPSVRQDAADRLDALLGGTGEDGVGVETG